MIYNIDLIVWKFGSFYLTDNLVLSLRSKVKAPNLLLGKIAY